MRPMLVTGCSKKAQNKLKYLSINKGGDMKKDLPETIGTIIGLLICLAIIIGLFRMIMWMIGF